MMSKKSYWTLVAVMGILCVSLVLSSSISAGSTVMVIPSGISSDGPSEPSMGDVGVDPPVVRIVDLALNDVEVLTVSVDEAFCLVGLATGAIPLYYFWIDGEIIATGQYLLDYTFSEPGEHVITLEVVDAYDQSGFDSVLVIVEGGSSEPTVNDLIDSLICCIEENGGFAEPHLRNLLVNRLNGLVDQLNAWIAELEALGDRCPRLAERIQRFIDHLNDRIDKLNARIDALNALPTKQDAMITKLLECKDLPAAEAYQKVLRDIKPKLTGLKEDGEGNPWGNGVFRNPWVVDADCRALYLAPINEILLALAAQL